MARGATIRQALRVALLEGAATARDLSGRVSVREKDVAHHLLHLQRTVGREGFVLHVTPASCVACGFSFETRTRLSRPSRCPQCASERVEPPVFRLVQRDRS